MFKSKWKKVGEIKVGDKIAVVRPSADIEKTDLLGVSSKVDFEEIVSIKKVGREKVWDIEVEGTHNFVGNGILAHNTYINGKLTANSDSIDADALLFSVQNTGTNVFNVDAEGDYSYAGTGSSIAADYAEYFLTKDTDLQAGEAVCIDILNPNSVSRCRGIADPNIMGIVSTKPALVGNAKPEFIGNKNYVVIAMLGQIPAKVSNENGEIRIGDSLTASSTPGYVMKANAGDSTVGVALENMRVAPEGTDSTSGNIGTGTVQVMISRRNKSLTVEAVEEKVTERIANMQIEDEVSRLVASAVSALTPQNTLTLDENGNVILASDPNQIIDILANNAELRGITDSLLTLQSDYESLKASLNSKVSDIKSSIAGSVFEKEYIAGERLSSRSIVSFDGKKAITATSASRDNIIGVVSSVDVDLETVTVSARGRVFVTVTNENGEVKKGDPITVSTSQGGLGSKAITEGMMVGYALSDAEYSGSDQSEVEIAISLAWYQGSGSNLAFDSSVLDLSGVSELASLKVEKDSVLYGNLNVIGDSRFTNLSTTGNLNVGLMALSSDDNSINVAGDVLKLQNEYGAGNIEAFGGKIVITNTGDIKVLGEITASKYNVDISDVAGASAGKALVVAGQKEITVETNALTLDSLIFVTVEDSTSSFTYEVLHGDGAGDGAGATSEKVAIRIYTETPVEKDTTVNWWIVN